MNGGKNSNIKLKMLSKSWAAANVLDILGAKMAKMSCIDAKKSF
jgi:hypothetical protein